MNNHCPKTDCPWHNLEANEHCGCPTLEDMKAANCPYTDRVESGPCKVCGQTHEYEVRQWGSGPTKWTVRKHNAELGDGLSFHWKYGELAKVEVPLAHLGFAFSEIECLRNQLAKARATPTGHFPRQDRKEGGWQIDTKYIKRIAEIVGMSGDVSWEDIEAVLLAVEAIEWEATK